MHILDKISPLLITKHWYPETTELCVDWVKMKGLPCSSVVKTLPSKAGGTGSIPGQGTKIPHASRAKNQKHNTETAL